jgi:hypothetical protein
MKTDKVIQIYTGKRPKLTSLDKCNIHHKKLSFSKRFKVFYCRYCRADRKKLAKASQLTIEFTLF